MSVKLELYRVFKEVAEAGNITAAAQALYISQSAVSQSIKQLEGELQTRLFARNSRGVALTPDGRMLYEYVRSAIGLLETGEEKLSQSRELQMGHLTIGASDTVTSQFLLPYLERFHRQYPAIHIQIVSGRSHKVLGLLQSGKVDIAFASTPQESASLETHPASPPTPCSWRRRTIPATSAMSILWRRSPPSPDPFGAQGLLPAVSGEVLPANGQRLHRRSSWAHGACWWIWRPSASGGGRHGRIRPRRAVEGSTAKAGYGLRDPAPQRGSVRPAGRASDPGGPAVCRLRKG
ncbi:MAG: LysR family transcriptional regulator [Oscillospiraceae bacterium]